MMFRAERFGAPGRRCRFGWRILLQSGGVSSGADMDLDVQSIADGLQGVDPGIGPAPDIAVAS